MKTKFIGKLFASICLTFLLSVNALALTLDSTYLKAVINVSPKIEVEKSTIFDASQSFIPDPSAEIEYHWDFGDGNKNDGVEVLHSYKIPGNYTITLTVNDGVETSISTLETFVYSKAILLLTDQIEYKDRIEIIQNFAEKKGIDLQIIESFGASTEFISEEILTKKLTEQAQDLKATGQILVWTSENAGLNAISRYIQNTKKSPTDFSKKSIILITNDLGSEINQAQRQFELIKSKQIIVTKEGSIDALIETQTSDDFINTVQERGSEIHVIDQKSGQLRPWNFMNHFVTVLINNGIPDNTIALLLLLPVIATVVAFMRQVIGISTFGIYTPSIITLSFLIIGIQAGLLTLISAILVGALSKMVLKRVRMLFIPKIAIVMSLVSLALLLVLIASIYLNFFNAEFLSIAIFPMLILSTLVEKFVSGKGEGNLSTTTLTMSETVLVSIIAYFIAGGEIDLGIIVFKFEFIKRTMLIYPELILLFIVFNVLLGKWTGLRLLERVRFREIFKHIEE